MVKKPQVTAFQNFFQIENPLNIKEVVSKTCLYVLWAFDQLFIVFDIFNTFNMSNKMSNSVYSVA